MILSYARFKRIFYLRVEDAEVTGGDWDEVLRNTRINSALSISLLLHFDPAKYANRESEARVPLVHSVSARGKEPGGLRSNKAR